MDKRADFKVEPNQYEPPVEDDGDKSEEGYECEEKNNEATRGFRSIECKYIMCLVTGTVPMHISFVS